MCVFLILLSLHAVYFCDHPAHIVIYDAFLSSVFSVVTRPGPAVVAKGNKQE